MRQRGMEKDGGVKPPLRCLRGRARIRYIQGVIPFEPHAYLKNPHAMTLAGQYWPRSLQNLGEATERYFDVEPGTKILAHCHWQAEPRRHPTLVIVHGLEGSSSSRYVLGTAERAWVAGFNVLRMNQRNCGGTDGLTPTLYNSGRSGDFRFVMRELAELDAQPEIFLAGFSMGGNLLLKAAGELGDATFGLSIDAFRGVTVVCPALDLAACADAIHARQNVIYEWNFVHNLKIRYRQKVALFPEIYSVNGLDRVHSVRDFDEVVTAPHCGYGNAVNYYDRASAMHVVGKIKVPALVITAQDDTMVPYESVRKPALLGNPNVTFVAPEHGGHCAFISRHGGDERFWAEKRIVEFCAERSELLKK
jgi:predicted alpha/beta-fold hydrolase